MDINQEIILEVIKNPADFASPFQLQTTITINSSGYPNSLRQKKDNQVIFGRSKKNLVDVCFHIKNHLCSRNHLKIFFDPRFRSFYLKPIKKIYNALFVLEQKKSYLLLKNMAILVGKSDIFQVTEIQNIQRSYDQIKQRKRNLKQSDTFLLKNDKAQTMEQQRMNESYKQDESQTFLGNIRIGKITPIYGFIKEEDSIYDQRTVLRKYKKGDSTKDNLNIKQGKRLQDQNNYEEKTQLRRVKGKTYITENPNQQAFIKDQEENDPNKIDNDTAVLKLRCIAGELEFQEWTFRTTLQELQSTVAKFYVGRSNQCTISISEDELIPQRAVIIGYTMADGWNVTLAEKNKNKLYCFVNMNQDEIIPYRLEEKMIFDVGDTHFLVKKIQSQ